MNMELYHYGVKGMKWGVRRAKSKELKSANKEYSTLQKKATRNDGIYTSSKDNELRVTTSAKKLYTKTRSEMNEVAKKIYNLENELGKKQSTKTLDTQKTLMKSGYSKEEARVLASRQGKAVRDTTALSIAAVGSLASKKLVDRRFDLDNAKTPIGKLGNSAVKLGHAAVTLGLGMATLARFTQTNDPSYFKNIEEAKVVRNRGKSVYD